MPNVLHEFLSNVRLADVLDVAVVAVVLYALIGWLMKRASRAVLLVTIAGLILYLTARQLQMSLTLTFFQVGFTAIAVGLILVFQDDLRWAVERLVGWSFLRKRRPPGVAAETVDTVVETISSLASRKVGGLIVFKGHQPLERHLRGGAQLSGTVSMPLLLSIFEPHSPGHDGAVIVEHGLVERFAAHLPLSANHSKIGRHGTRHAAAVGLAELSDALVIVVSEESGRISLAEDGILHENLAIGQVRDRLLEHLTDIAERPLQSRTRNLFSHNLGLKAAAVSLACLLWLSFGYRRETVQRSFVIPVEYRNLAKNQVLIDPRPTEVRAVISAPETVLDPLDASGLVASIDAAKLGVGRHQVIIGESHLSLPAGATLEDVSPQQISVTIDRTTTVQLPVKPQFRGKLDAALNLQNVVIEPQDVTVLIPQSKRDTLSRIMTETIDLSEVRASETRVVSLILPEGVRPAQTALRVRVQLEVTRRNQPDSEATVSDQLQNTARIDRGVPIERTPQSGGGRSRNSSRHQELGAPLVCKGNAVKHFHWRNLGIGM